MGLMNLFKRQLSQVIQWQNDDPDLFWEQYQSNNKDEIKNASKLIVSQGQGCILVYEGKIVDMVTEGIFNLKTDNHPFITNLTKLRTQFESEHKLFLYFYKTIQALNQHWGTASPIKYHDPIYDIPVELGINGNYSFEISDIKKCFIQIIGSQTYFTFDGLRQIINGRIPALIANVIVSAQYTYGKLDEYLPEISDKVQLTLNKDLEDLGINITNFKITGTIFDKQTMERINKFANISIDISAAEKAGMSYIQLEKLRALRDIAQNESNGSNVAGMAMELGIGLELAKQFNQSETLTNSEDETDILHNKLRKLKFLLDEQIITEADYEEKKKEILQKL